MCIRDSSGVHTDNVKMSTNPPDDNAVEESVKLKESGKVKEVVAISIGEDKAQETIRKALAVGADKGIHVKADNYIEPLGIAKILKKIVEKENRIWFFWANKLLMMIVIKLVKC